VNTNTATTKHPETGYSSQELKPAERTRTPDVNLGVGPFIIEYPGGKPTDTRSRGPQGRLKIRPLDVKPGPQIKECWNGCPAYLGQVTQMGKVNVPAGEGGDAPLCSSSLFYV